MVEGGGETGLQSVMESEDLPLFMLRVFVCAHVRVPLDISGLNNDTAVCEAGKMLYLPYKDCTFGGIFNFFPQQTS